MASLLSCIDEDAIFMKKKNQCSIFDVSFLLKVGLISHEGRPKNVNIQTKKQDGHAISRVGKWQLS